MTYATKVQDGTAARQQADDALSRQNWHSAALLYTDAADAEAAASNPHGAAGASEIGLRRSAHLALCRTPEFLAYRERMGEQKPRPDLSHERLKPRGSLVRALLSSTSVGRVHQRDEVAA